MSEKRILFLEDLLCGGQTASQRQDHARTQVGLRASAVTERCDPACRWGLDGIARREGQGLGKVIFLSRALGCLPCRAWPSRWPVSAGLCSFAF